MKSASKQILAVSEQAALKNPPSVNQETVVANIKYLFQTYRQAKVTEEEKGGDSIEQQMYKRAFGSVFGAFIGDAAGAVLEFKSLEHVQKNIDKALTFPGGGSL